MGKEKQDRQDGQIVKISVRNLVEFILRSGDLDNTSGARSSAEAMQEGTRIHKKLQKQMGAAYQAEVPLSLELPVEREGVSFSILLEGRADGIFTEEGEDCVTIDEIKGMYADVAQFQEPLSVHLAQAKCYAYMYSRSRTEEPETVAVRMTYCNIETEAVKYFKEYCLISELEKWFDTLILEYSKWALWQYRTRLERDASIRQTEFPFPYREGQRELVTGVYRTVLREKNLFIEAPTGVGKTISTVFPSVRAMGEGLAEKIFYLTAKTITRTVAQNTFRLLGQAGARIKTAVITAKEKQCILGKPDCNPVSCERAGGHFDRINDAVYDLITHETEADRDHILQYAQKHCVCPFEMCLDVTLWMDAIICDYNYIFDPNVYLRRFFSYDRKNNYIFLIDEAHNLVDRAREMYSAVLFKEGFLETKRLHGKKNTKFTARLEDCNKDMLRWKRECEKLMVLEHISDFVLHLNRLMTEFEEFLDENRQFEGKDKILEFYFSLRHFLNIFELLDDKYQIYADFTEEGSFFVKLQCMDPSNNLRRCLEKGRSAVFFSATLLPVHYYKEQLGGEKEDYAIYAPSPFQPENRLIMVASDVSTRYKRRSEQEYKKILGYISGMVAAKKGNYMAFFPSYQFMREIALLAEQEAVFSDCELLMQQNSMNEEEREDFLHSFVPNPERSHIGFCVMGGIFSEGIDLTEDRLIGAAIVGPGLPMVCGERELFREYFEREKEAGFDYAYLYGGMNKVLQSAGRVIRTTEDRGVILLLDDRFCREDYQTLFPREWYPFRRIRSGELKEYLNEFWEKGD